MTITYEIANAAAKDKANKNMCEQNRSVWNEEDFNIACAEMERLLASPKVKGK